MDAAANSLKERRLVDVPVRIVWPPQTDRRMLDRHYHRLCKDCGLAFKARDLHLFLTSTEDGKLASDVLCPDCAAKRGTVHVLELVAKHAPGPVPQRTLRPRVPVLPNPRQPLVRGLSPSSLLSRIRAAEAARRKGKSQ